MAIELTHEILTRITSVTEETRETTFLFQRLSMALQRGNAVSFQHTLTSEWDVIATIWTLLTFNIHAYRLCAGGPKNYNNCLLVWAMDGHKKCCGTISSCQSAATTTTSTRQTDRQRLTWTQLAGHEHHVHTSYKRQHSLIYAVVAAPWISPQPTEYRPSDIPAVLCSSH